MFAAFHHLHQCFEGLAPSMIPATSTWSWSRRLRCAVTGFVVSRFKWRWFGKLRYIVGGEFFTHLRKARLTALGDKACSEVLVLLRLDGSIMSSHFSTQRRSPASSSAPWEKCNGSIFFGLRVLVSIMLGFLAQLQLPISSTIQRLTWGSSLCFLLIWGSSLIPFTLPLPCRRHL